MLNTKPLLDPLEEVRRSRQLIDLLDAWLYDEIEPYIGQRVMEVGSGHGNFIRHFLTRELVVATEIAPSSVRLLSNKFAQYPNIRPQLYDICTPVAEDLRSMNIDTIVSLNVLEHIEDDLGAMCHMAEILKDGGRVVLIVPAHQWLYGTMDSPIGHFRRYSKQTMANKLQKAGFTVEKQFYLNLLGVLGWFVNGRLLKQKVPPRGQLQVFNKIVPIIRWVEQKFRPPVGLSLVTVARKNIII